MKNLSRRTRVIVLMAVSQAACLVVGLWIQDQFVVAMARWNAESVAIGDDAPAPTRTHEASGSLNAPTDVLSYEALRDAMVVTGPFAFVWIATLQTVVIYLGLTRLHVRHEEKVSRSHESSLARTKELVRTRDAVVFGLAKLAESRDPDTGHHLERIALYSTRLATAMRRDRRFRDEVNTTFVRSIGISSALHDIGKVGVADAILLKPGKLTTEERTAMQLHTHIGGECIRRIEQRLGSSNFLEMAREIAYCHHERWDGSGYPAGLSGERIPLAARIVSIVDVYDALSSRRAYKEPIPHEQCIEMIRNQAGRQFDPDLVSVFLSIESQLRGISERFREEPNLDTDVCRDPRLGEPDAPAAPRSVLSGARRFQEAAGFAVTDPLSQSSFESTDEDAARFDRKLVGAS